MQDESAPKLIWEPVMLASEWQEFEAITAIISSKLNRCELAEQSMNFGLVESLQAEIRIATQVRERLLDHISVRLGSVAVEHPGGAAPG